MSRGYLLLIAEQQRLKERLIISCRLLRSTSNPLDLPAKNFVAHFRLTKPQFLRLCEEVFPLLKRRRKSAIRPDLKVLAAVAFYANGAYQKNIGAYYHLGLAQSSVHDCLCEITDALNSTEILKKYIKFPFTQEERDAVKRKFMDTFQFPDVVGCIDGTHVAIIRPHKHEEAYFNNKLYYSLNVLIVCDADLRILYIDASFGGASDDSQIWDQCPVQNYMQRLHDQNEVCWLLGDSGYAQSRFLMTPILGATPESPEEYYMQCHVQTRKVVERCIGVLKSRWQCLLAPRVLHYSPVKAGKFVNACAVLHNFINNEHFPIHDNIQLDLSQQVNLPHEGHGSADEGRQAVVDRLWRSRRV